MKNRAAPQNTKLDLPDRDEKPVPDPVEPQHRQSAGPHAKMPTEARPSASPPVEKIYRPSVSPRQVDVAKLAQRGIRKYETKHLRLFTDIDPELAKPLPTLVDAVYAEWEKLFGALPPNREKSVFQITGYLMADTEKFREMGLIPDDLPRFNQGRHRLAEFWMYDQATDYYRRHLVLHEATHCYTTFVPNSPLSLNGIRQGAWYVEGIAELFGTHEIDGSGKVKFRIFPAQKVGFANWGRTEIIREELRAGRGKTLHQVLDLHPEDFLKNECYGWAWGLCQLLDQHPRYAPLFRRLVKEGRPALLTEDFRNIVAAQMLDLEEEWLLFCANIDYGYDIVRAAIDFQEGQPLSAQSRRVNVVADRGWQSSGVAVTAGQRYRITAKGRCTLAQSPRPWESEPQGISIRYSQGRPIGQLLGTIRSSTRPEKYPQTTMLNSFPIGRELLFKAQTTGALYLRVSDFWNELADNNGSYQIEIRKD